MGERAVELVVREAKPRDAGRGIVRLPAAARRELGVLSGDTVVIEGTSATVATVWPTDGEDGTCRVDGELRANAGVRVGDRVRVRARSTPLADARRVVVAATGNPPADAATVTAAVGRALRERPVVAGDRIRVDGLGEEGEFRVVETVPEGPTRVTDATDVAVETPSGGTGEAGTGEVGTGGAGDAGGADGERRVGTTYEDVGGLGAELDQVRELIEMPLSHPELFRRLGVEPPKGVLLYGPPGTGKTLIARAVANEVDAHFLTVSGPEVVRKYKGESEERLREVFETARANAPTVVFFDEIDAIAGKREDGDGMEGRLVAQLLSLLDGLDPRGEVVVIGATNRVDALDPALRRPGRFDREVEVGVPDKAGRAEILSIHTRGMPLAGDVDVARLAGHTHGFVGADLRALAAEAALAALRRAREAGADPEAVTVTRADFDRALAAVEPSALREFVAETPDVDFDDVGGLDEQKQTLREAIAWPLSYPNLFDATATDPPTGILLHGPPGTGKTLLARAIARESGVNVIRVAGPELVDKYVGESEKAVRRVFDRARQAAPAVVFFDEIDAIARRRDGDGGVGERVVSQLLTELDGAADNPSLVVLAATNRRAVIDPALLRPGRLETHVEVPAPDERARREILAVHARGKPLADGVDLGALAAGLTGYTGADLAAVVREASMRAIREAARTRGVDEANAHADEIRVTTEHFRAAIETSEAGGGR